MCSEESDHMQSVQHSGAGGASQPKPCLVFKAAGFNALIREGTGYTGRVAHEYKSTASKLLGGNNTDRRDAYVSIQKNLSSRGCVFLTLNAGAKKCNRHA